MWLGEPLGFIAVTDSSQSFDRLKLWASQAGKEACLDGEMCRERHSLRKDMFNIYSKINVTFIITSCIKSDTAFTKCLIEKYLSKYNVALQE